MLQGRQYGTTPRYTYNGKQLDVETGWQDYGMRNYLVDVPVFASVDPIDKEYPELTPYQFSDNSPIENIDLDGLEKWSVVIRGKTRTTYGPLTVNEAAKRMRVFTTTLIKQNDERYGSHIEVVTPKLVVKKAISKNNHVNASSKNLPEHLKVAINEIGQTEIKGSKNNLRITNDYFGSVGLRGSSDDNVPWCSAFANYCIDQSGLKGTNNAMALSWRKWSGGEKVSQPYLGDLVTIRHSNGTGHVGFVTGQDGNRISILGGNQAFPGGGNNGMTVNNKWNIISSNMIFVHPIGFPKITLPKIPIVPVAASTTEQITSGNSR